MSNNSIFSIKNLLVLGLAISGASAGVIRTDKHPGLLNKGVQVHRR